MLLIDLPEEIVIKIIRDLDLVDLQNMYNTCTYIRNIVTMNGVIKECNISMNTLATVRTLKLDFFKDISGHLQVLNMCGVPDLSKSSLLPAMKKLKKLKSLDISYTNISIIDLLNIHQVCPTILNISINFTFGKPGHNTVIPQKTLIQCQNLFKNFKNIHFVGSLSNLMYSKLALNILQKAKLNKLKYTITECAEITTTDHHVECNQLPQFTQFSVYLLNWKETNAIYGCFTCFPTLSMLELNKYEFIIIIMLNLSTYSVYVSKLFKNFFHDKLAIEAEYITEFTKSFLGNVAIMIWDQNCTKFDEDFFLKLEKSLRQNFPCYFLSPTSKLASGNWDWFFTTPTPPVQETEETDPYKCAPELKKRRIVAPNLILNYDSIFEMNDKIKLGLVFISDIKNAVSLTSSCNYLKKLTYLSLSGTVRYSSEFFNILFRCCDNLVTLNVEAPSISPCASPISRSVPLSRCLKNMRLVDKRIDFRTLFSSLSQCKTLENIHVQEVCESDPGDIGDPSIILEKCDNLYNLYIEAPMTDTARTKKLTLLNKAKSRCGKFGLNVKLHAKSIDNRYQYNYDPFVDVFNLFPIKQV